MNDKVVILDDSLTVRMDLAEAFEIAGFNTFPCGTVREARAILAKEMIGVAVLDVLLPDGNGVELLQEIRSSGKKVAVLMLSSESEVRDRVRALQIGADEYVGKPYDTGYVIAKSRELLRARAQNSTSSQPTVLVIDDSLTFREVLWKSFERAGYSVLLAGSGEDGLRLAADHRPNAIVVDGVLPGIDGATVIRRVRLDAALRGTPCLLLTASEDRGAELRALDAGADAFIRKEEDVEVILAKLAASLRGASSLHNDVAVSLFGPRKILAVDDSLTYLQEISSLLRGEGFDVVPAHSGEEALEFLAIQPVDCILLDLLMPGLGGKETCRRIKSAPTLRDTPVILLTSLEDRDSMMEGLGVGADDYISKSSEFEVLKARVDTQLRRKQFEDETRRIHKILLQKELEATEARAAKELAETKAALAEELEFKNKELEAFSYSVSHDLRAPLRMIEGFSKILSEDYGERLDTQANGYLQRVRTASQRMSEMIDDLLELSRVTRAELRKQSCDLGEIARSIFDDLKKREPNRKAELICAEGLVVEADRGLLRTVLENLVGNAWKFTKKREQARLELGSLVRVGKKVFYLKDNGAGFDMKYAQKLFQPFQRLHTPAEFEGTGIGLATVHRIITRHGGRIWAEGARDQGATIYFTLQESPVH